MKNKTIPEKLDLSKRLHEAVYGGDAVVGGGLNHAGEWCAGAFTDARIGVLSIENSVHCVGVDLDAALVALVRVLFEHLRSRAREMQDVPMLRESAAVQLRAFEAEIAG